MRDVLVAGVHVIWSISRPVTNPNAIFAIETGQWVVSFYSLTLATNLIATSEYHLLGGAGRHLLLSFSAASIQDLVDEPCREPLAGTQEHAAPNHDHDH